MSLAMFHFFVLRPWKEVNFLCVYVCVRVCVKNKNDAVLSEKPNKSSSRQF